MFFNIFGSSTPSATTCASPWLLWPALIMADDWAPPQGYQYGVPYNARVWSHFPELDAHPPIPGMAELAAPYAFVRDLHDGIMEDDLYGLLGAEPTATEQQIRAACRRLSIQVRPYKFKGDTTAITALVDVIKSDDTYIKSIRCRLYSLSGEVVEVSYHVTAAILQELGEVCCQFKQCAAVNFTNDDAEYFSIKSAMPRTGRLTVSATGPNDASRRCLWINKSAYEILSQPESREFWDQRILRVQPQRGEDT